jgi:hypothetical protein
VGLEVRPFVYLVDDWVEGDDMGFLLGDDMGFLLGADVNLLGF